MSDTRSPFLTLHICYFAMLHADWGALDDRSSHRLAPISQLNQLATVFSYRTVVEIGVIWMYLGDTSNAPPRPPVSEHNGGQSPQCITFMSVLPYSYETVAEYVLELEHVKVANGGAHELVHPCISVLPRKFEFLGRTGHLL